MTEPLEPLPTDRTRPSLRVMPSMKKLPPATEAKLGRLSILVRARLTPELRSSEFISKVKSIIGAIINEESTDLLASIVSDLVPWGLGKPVGWALDKLLPEKLLLVVWTLLDRVSD